MSDYQRTLEWLYALEAAKGMDFKLERVTLALQRFGNPHRRFPSFHVAGTNGKGSVAAMLHAVLVAAGYRVGLYISPHLVSLTERIRVDGEEITPAAVVSLTTEIQRVATSGGIELTFFEFLTVMAFVHFARQQITVGVIEVGLGGRLDATNVIDPAVAVITTIGRDHIKWLGESVAAIAAEKGGIIKPRRTVVLGDVGRMAAAVLRRLAVEHQSPVLDARRYYRVRDDEQLDFEGLGWCLPRLAVGLRGSFQRENAATALTSLAAVRDRIPVTEAAIRSGLGSLRWPGRLEIVGMKPVTILDGAHNADAIVALVQNLPPIVRGRRLHVLFAVMRDKEWFTMVERLAPIAHSATITEILPPRAAPAMQVAEAFRRYCPTSWCCDPQLAWQRVVAQSQPNDAILVTGSLFLIGAIYPGAARDGAPVDMVHP